jgi:hypothetical protein
VQGSLSRDERAGARPREGGEGTRKSRRKKSEKNFEESVEPKHEFTKTSKKEKRRNALSLSLFLSLSV